MGETKKIPLRAVVFIALALGIFVLLNAFVQPAWMAWNNYYTMNGFYEEPENRIETVFLGSSAVASGVDPMRLYQDYGMCTYNLATEQQPLLVSYYLLQEAYRFHPQTLKNVVLDVSILRSEPKDAFYRKGLMGMKPSKIKYQALLDYNDGNKKEALLQMLPLYAYHDRWDSLVENDFQKFFLEPLNGTRGYYFVTDVLADSTEPEDAKMRYTKLDPMVAGAELNEDSVEYLLKICQFCKENDLDLTLVRLHSGNWMDKYHNAVVSLIEENNLQVPFVDLNYDPYYEDIKYLYLYDNFDNAHLNYFGAQKTTRWLGEYLTENCRTTDVRGDVRYAYMEEQQALYQKNVQQKVDLITATTLSDYLKAASGQENAILISLKSEAADGLSQKDKDCLRTMGLSELADIGSADSGYAVLEGGNVLSCAVKSGKERDDLLLKNAGSLSDGSSYSIESGSIYHGNNALITINGKQSARNLRGFNVVVFDTKTQMVIDSARFDTHTGALRDCYDLSMVSAFDGVGEPEMENNTVYQKALAYQQRFNEEKTANSAMDMSFSQVLKLYAEQENKMLLMSVKGDVSAMDTQSRSLLANLGLSELAAIGPGDRYLGYFKDGMVKYDLRSDDESLVIDEFGLTLKSANSDDDGIASIKINDTEYSLNAPGINLVVYDTDSDGVVFINNYEF